MGYLRRRIIAKSFTTTSAPPLLSSALFCIPDESMEPNPVATPPRAPCRRDAALPRQSSRALRFFPLSALSPLLSVLPCRPARKRPRQRQRRDIPCLPPRLLRMVRKIFLHHANDSHRALSIGHARQPVPSRHAQQFITHQEALGKASHPAQAHSIPPCLFIRNVAPRVSVPLAVLFNACTFFRPSTLFKPYTRADFQ